MLGRDPVLFLVSGRQRRPAARLRLDTDFSVLKVATEQFHSLCIQAQLLVGHMELDLCRPVQ